MDREVRAGSIPASSTKMKKILFITALVTLASCSNETSTTLNDSICLDSTCTDSICSDSFIPGQDTPVSAINALYQETE